MEAARVEGEPDRDGSGEEAAAIWKGGGGGCDLEGMSATVGEKGRGGVVGDWGWGRGRRTAAAAGWFGIERLRRRRSERVGGWRLRGEWIGGEEWIGEVRVWVRG